ncbi:MAG: OmpA family protein [Chitinophagales bacterium]|nr:OmpA family protein [Chitinophagales bacterium]
MRYLKLTFLLLGLISLGTSCVSKKKFNETNAALEATKNLLTDCEQRTKTLQGQVDDLTAQLNMANQNLKKANDELTSANMKLKSAEDQLMVLRNSQSSLLDQLNSASVINKAGAESIKKSLDAISQQSSYIKELTQKMQYKDSVNLALAMNLKKSLKDFNDKDVSIEVKKGVVYISLSDNMLFKTASASINASAQNVLGKIASILNDQSDLDILVEGHTDNVPMGGECITDNWDLSSKRALAVVKTLQSKYKVDPARMTAGARGEYAPKSTNKTAAGRQANRRTEIIVLPKLDQFFKLMEAPEGK